MPGLLPAEGRVRPARTVPAGSGRKSGSTAGPNCSTGASPPCKLAEVGARTARCAGPSVVVDARLAGPPSQERGPSWWAILVSTPRSARDSASSTRAAGGPGADHAQLPAAARVTSEARCYSPAPAMRALAHAPPLEVVAHRVILRRHPAIYRADADLFLRGAFGEPFDQSRRIASPLSGGAGAAIPWDCGGNMVRRGARPGRPADAIGSPGLRGSMWGPSPGRTCGE